MGRRRNWSPQDDALLRDHAERGLSTRHAAAALTPPVTRNAVIGRADRQGIHFAPEPEVVAGICRPGLDAYWAPRRAEAA